MITVRTFTTRIASAYSRALFRIADRSTARAKSGDRRDRAAEPTPSARSQRLRETLPSEAFRTLASWIRAKSVEGRFANYTYDDLIGMCDLDPPYTPAQQAFFKECAVAANRPQTQRRTSKPRSKSKMN